MLDARASTGVAGRGPAAFALFIDEMAHLAAPGLQRSADEVYAGAVPALAQFATDSIVFMASSPGSQVGEFFAAYQRALAVRHSEPADPTIMTVQLPSWGTYLDWELTQVGLAMYPGGPDFEPLAAPIIADDELMRRRQVANPDSFAVEHLARWRTSLEHYLDPDLVQRIFGGYRGRPLSMQFAGRADVDYIIHADPSTSGANFAIAVGHDEVGGDGATHVVFDHLRVFRPRDFADGRIDYLQVEEALRGLIEAFRPTLVTFDQHNSAMLIQRLRNWHRAARLPRSPSIALRTATACRNWEDAELFKTSVGLGLVHAPPHELARDELLYLQQRHDRRVDHPTSGPVRTSDLADAMFAVVAHVLDGSGALAGQLGSLALGMSRPGGLGLGTAQDRAVFAGFERVSRSTRGDQRRGNPARGRRL